MESVCACRRMSTDSNCASAPGTAPAVPMRLDRSNFRATGAGSWVLTWKLGQRRYRTITLPYTNNAARRKGYIVTQSMPVDILFPAFSAADPFAQRILAGGFFFPLQLRFDSFFTSSHIPPFPLLAELSQARRTKNEPRDEPRKRCRGSRNIPLQRVRSFLPAFQRESLPVPVCLLLCTFTLTPARDVHPVK